MHFFNPSEQIFATSFPTLVLPVKVTFFTNGCRHRLSLKVGVLSKLVGNTLNTPFGNPAFSARYASDRTEKGVSGDGLTTIVQPAASAAPALRKIMAIGKFQGTSATATPIGCLTVNTLLPGAEGV